MGSCPSRQRVAPAIVHVPMVTPPTEKRKVEIILVNTNHDEEHTARCLKALKDTCAQNHVDTYNSFENALNHIRRLDKTITIILVYIGKSYEDLKKHMPSIDTFSNVRNFFIYSNENENKERPTETTVQHVCGNRHLLAAIRDALEAVNASPIHKYSSQQVSFALHQSSINALLSAINSIQFEALIIGLVPLIFKLSQMNVILSPSIFKFIAQVELVNAPRKLSRFTTTQVYGEAELKLEKKGTFIAVTHFIVELTKKLRRDVAKYIPNFPLDGLINFGYPFDLPQECETKRLILEAKNPKIIIEDKLIKLFVDINYTRVAKADK